MKISSLLAAAVLCAAVAHANTVRVYQTTSDPAQDELSFTYTLADLVGEFQSNLLDFDNWHPYGLDHFAVEITGEVYSNAPTEAFFMGGADSNGWFHFEIGGWGYMTFYAYDSHGDITLVSEYPIGELGYPPGFSPFRLTYQTSPYDSVFGGSSSMVGPSFHSNLPYDGWSGDPDAIGYQVGMVITPQVPDEAPTATLLLITAIACIGLLAVGRRRPSAL